MKKENGLKKLFTTLTLIIASAFLYAQAKYNLPANTETASLPEQFLETVSSAYTYLEKNDYSQAIKEYTKSKITKDFFKTYRETFNSKRSSSKYTSELDRSLEKLIQESQKFSNIQNELTLSAENYRQSLKNEQGTSVIQANEAKFKGAFKSLIECRNSVAKEVDVIKEIHSEVTDFSSRNDVTYSLLLVRYSAGLTGTDNTGILGIMNTQIDSIIESIRNDIIPICREDSKKLQNLLPKSKISAYPSDFQDAYKLIPHLMIYLQRLKGLNEISSLQSNINSSSGYKNNDSWKKSADSSISLTENIQKMLSVASESANETNKSTTLKQSDNAVTSFRSGKETYGAEMRKSAAFFSDTGKTATAAKNEKWLGTYNSLPDSFRFLDEAKNTYLTICNELINTTSVQATKTWIILANYYAATAEQMVLEGKSYNDSFTSDKTHPSKAITLLSDSKTTLSRDIELLSDFQVYLEEGYQYRTNFAQQKKDIATHQATLKQISETTTALISEATNLKNIALSAKSQVELYYNRAQSYFNAGEYSVAHTNLERATLTYNQQKENLQKDTDIQEECYKKLLEVRQEFIEREKPVLVNEIRTYKNNAKNSYYAGEFEQANATLSKAESRRNEWAKLMDTTLDADDELQRIKEMVNTALSIKEGRVIYPQDPLYAEMSQLLSIAKTYFEKGKNTLEKGNKTEGEKYLNLSKNKVNEIKLIYPRNQEASILSLKIDQLLDKDSFDQMFKDKISSFKKINFSQRDALAMDSYNELLNLYEINPSYQGLKTMIQDIEIDLGLKQKPVSSTNIQKAQSLANEAKKILDKAGRDEQLLSQAKDKANSAIALNQNNDLAIQVLDEIALRSGGSAAVVLSAKDEEKYQAAVKDLQMNNIFSAKQKIDELLKNPDNKRSAKILKLQKRVEALL